jgi:hypothetical protein
MPLSVVTLGADELRSLIRDAVAEAIVAGSRRSAHEVERITAARAAKMVHRRPGVVLAACATGALPASRGGKSWSVRVADLDAWAAAGCPVSP